MEVILIPQEGYDKWTPMAGLDETKAGNQLRVKVELRKKGTDQKPLWITADKFTFQLVDTSKQPGTCLNWPPAKETRSPADFDLKIDPNQNPDSNVEPDGQSATSKKPDQQQMTIKISSYDWGGWSKLKVAADLSNGQKNVAAELQGQPGVKEVSIPKDDNDHIADAWKKKNSPPNSSAESDDDDFPHNEKPQGDGDSGDGLSLYEEYRGFMIKGEHVSTSPKQKDVFIYDRHLLGLGSFAMSHHAAHLINHNEFVYDKAEDPNPRVINFNHSDFAHLGAVHVVELLDNPVDGGLGYTEGGPDVPKYIRYAAVDRKNCLRSKYKQLELTVNIAHELGHTTNVAHHGDNNYGVPYAGEHYTSPVRCTGPKQPAGVVAVQGGQNSGAQECIMRYYRAQYVEDDGGAYCLPIEDDNRNIAFKHGASYGPTQTPGTIFCTSSAGTGMNGRNAPSKTANLGDATRGDCAHQFCVNDPKHKQARAQ